MSTKNIYCSQPRKNNEFTFENFLTFKIILFFFHAVQDNSPILTGVLPDIRLQTTRIWTAHRADINTYEWACKMCRMFCIINNAEWILLSLQIRQIRVSGLLYFIIRICFFFLLLSVITDLCWMQKVKTTIRFNILIVPHTHSHNSDSNWFCFWNIWSMAHGLDCLPNNQ